VQGAVAFATEAASAAADGQQGQIAEEGKEEGRGQQIAKEGKEGGRGEQHQQHY
jgi:hypothetical protein